MKASEFFPSNYLNAETAKELAGKTYTIYEVNKVVIRDGDQPKMILGLEGVEKSIVINKTNATELIKAHGDETNDWIGKHVHLEIMKVQFKGERRDSIILTPTTAAAAPAQEPVIDADHDKPLSKKVRK